MDGEKAFFQVLNWLKKSPYAEFSVPGDRFSANHDKAQNVKTPNAEDSQNFSDHLLTSKRFQKTFYYGELSPNKFHPPLALTDVTLELFNKAVPNEGRLDILDMDYASHVSKSVHISPYSMILAMMYVDQLRHRNPDYLENVSPCDLYVISMLVASKYLFDEDEFTYYNYDWASGVNWEIEDLNKLEREFLSAIKWELFIKSSDYFAFLARIEQRIAYKKSFERGWLSYTDIFILSRQESFVCAWLHFSTFLMKVVIVVTVGYFVCISTLLGTFFLVKTASEKILTNDHHSIISHPPENIFCTGIPGNISNSLDVSDCEHHPLHSSLSYDLTDVTSIGNVAQLVNVQETTVPFTDESNSKWHSMHDEMNRQSHSQQIMPNLLKSSFSYTRKPIQDCSLNGSKSLNSVNSHDTVVLWPLYLLFSNESMNTLKA